MQIKINEELTNEQLNAIFGEIFEQSDRASAVVSGGILEEILKRMIAAFFLPISNIEVSMFSGFAPMSTFAAKIDISYHLGLINKAEYDDLKLIKSIRNDFAHYIIEINFETKEIKNRCLQLQTFKKTNPPQGVVDNFKSIKDLYKINVTMLASLLFLKRKEIKRIEPYKYKTVKI